MIIIPENQVTDTGIYQWHRITVRSQIIYMLIILMLFAIIISLPLMNIQLTITGRGIIRPGKEKTEVISLISKKVDSIYVQEGQSMHEGDPIIKLYSDEIDNQINHLNNKIEKTKTQIYDLELLCEHENIGNNSLISFYREEHIQFEHKMQSLFLKLDQYNKDKNRMKYLFEKTMISSKEYEIVCSRVEELEHELIIVKNEHLFRWRKELQQLRSLLADLSTELADIKKQRQQHLILAPVSGTVEQFRGIYPGSNISSGQTVAVISPDEEALCEVFLSTAEVGHIRPDNRVKVYIDGFPPNEWGSIEGKIMNISDDYLSLNGQPVFRINIALKNNHLKLNSGYKIPIRKGMTVQARFLMQERSLLDIIYQHTNNWINPAELSENNTRGK